MSRFDEFVDHGIIIEQNWSGFDAVTNSALDLSAQSVSGGDMLGPFSACPDGKSTSLIAVDFFFPSGLGESDNNGDMEAYTVTIDILYRDKGANSFTTERVSYNEATRDQLGFTHWIELDEPINPEVAFRRITADSDDAKIRDKVQIARLKCELPATKDYPDITSCMLAIRTTNAISANSEAKFNIRCTRLLNSVKDYINLVDYNIPLPEITPQTTLGAAYIYATLDAGYPMSGIDFHALKSIDDACLAAGQTYNDEISSESTLSAVQKKIMKCGYSRPIIDNGKLSAIREGLSDDLGHIFTPQNTIGKIKREGNAYVESEPDGVRVEFFPPDKVKPETVDCGIDGDLFLNPTTIQLRGCGDKTTAYRHGMRERNRLALKPKRYTFKTARDGFNLRIGKRAMIADLLCGGMQGFVTAYDKQSNVITLSEQVTFTQPLMIVVIRKHNGQSGKQYLCEMIKGNQVKLSGALDFAPNFTGEMERPIFVFGDADTIGEKIVIDSVSPSGDKNASVVAYQYMPEIYKDDLSLPPE